MMWNLRGHHWVMTYQNTRSLIRVPGHQARSLSPDCPNVRSISEPAELMCNVSLHCWAIGGLSHPSTPTHLAWVFLVVCATWDPHIAARSDFSLSSSKVQHTAKEIPPAEKHEVFQTQMSTGIPHVGLCSHPTIIRHNQSPHWCCKSEITVNCLGLWLVVRGVSISCSWLRSC